MASFGRGCRKFSQGPMFVTYFPSPICNPLCPEYLSTQLGVISSLSSYFCLQPLHDPLCVLHILCGNLHATNFPVVYHIKLETLATFVSLLYSMPIDSI